MENYMDLHMHSIFSVDGEYTPSELVGMCHGAGIRIMSISDHNCVGASRKAQEETERLGIRYIPAIELDCTFQGMDLHLLGYQIRYESPDFAAVECDIRRQSKQASLENLKLTRQLGFEVTADELNVISSKGTWQGIWSGETFAEVLLHKPEYQDNDLLFPYRTGGLRADNPYVNFYWDYYSQGKPCHAAMVYPSLADAIALIKDNGGKAVLAHPGNTLKNRLDLFDDIVAQGIDGVEAFSSYHDRQSADFFYREARKHSLIVTCGSDFHGKTKPSIMIGNSGCHIGQAEIEREFFPVHGG